MNLRYATLDDQDCAQHGLEVVVFAKAPAVAASMALLATHPLGKISQPDIVVRRCALARPRVVRRLDLKAVAHGERHSDVMEFDAARFLEVEFMSSVL